MPSNPLLLLEFASGGVVSTVVIKMSPSPNRSTLIGSRTEDTAWKPSVSY
jgi:hypothetical protein